VKSSQRDNQIYIAYQLRSFDFGVSFCADFGSSEQSSCGAAKNSPQDCFLNAATVLKEIIVYLLLSTPKSLMALGIFLPSGPRSKAPAAQLKTVHGVLEIKKVLCKTVGMIDFVGYNQD
jgi:hypothetical protein